MSWDIDEIRDLLDGLHGSSGKEIEETCDEIKTLLDNIETEIEDLEDDLSSCVQDSVKDIISLNSFKLAIGLDPNMDYSQADLDEFKHRLGVYFIPLIPIPKKKT